MISQHSLESQQQNSGNCQHQSRFIAILTDTFTIKYTSPNRIPLCFVSEEMESPPRDTVYDHFREPLKDVSFYDQPDEFSTMISPGAGALSDTSTISRRSSISSLSSEAESTCSSVDKVFFGPTSVKERTLIAKLSRVDLKGSNTVHVEEESGRENSIRRLVRRDSKEFHRRRTLGFSQRANLPNTPRRWADGFYLKGEERLAKC
jgi:hypothetical protein